jgi:hypothetical protein
MYTKIRKGSLLLLLLALIFSFTSCKEQLNEVVYSQLTTGNAFVTQNDALAAVNGIYSNLLNISWKSIFYANDLPTDVCYLENSPLEILKNNDMNQNSDLNILWSNFYVIVNQANTAIDKISKMSDSQFNDASGNATTLKKRYIAESKFLRGWAFMELSDIFYRIPINTNSEISPTTKLKLASIDSIDSQIIRDFTYASANLPASYSANEDAGRPTSGAANGMLAKAYMRIAGRKRLAGQDAKADWNTALKYVNAVIASNQYALQPTELDVFALDNSQVGTLGLAKGLRLNLNELYNNEIIWAIHSNGTSSQGSSPVGLSFTPWSFDMGWNLLNLPLEFAWSFNPADTRLTKLICTNFPDIYNSPNNTINKFYSYPPTINDVGTMYKEVKDGSGKTTEIHNELTACYTLKYKYQNTGNYNYNTANNVIILRYADILLMKAEILNELNQPNEAITYVNMIRERAFGDKTHDLSASGNQDAIRSEICDERGWELNMEAMRRPDLIRMGLWKDRMGKYFDEIKTKYQIKEHNAESIADREDPANAPHHFDYSSMWKIYPTSSSLTDNDVRRYYPIPITETDQNPNLLNNRPGE